jgi:thiamine biosynthesis lipoprotein
MTLSRRRFLTISAGLALAPQGAIAQTWQGRAFGAEVSMTIRGAHAAEVLQDSRQMIEKIESLFNLYDPNSALSRLNTTGEMSNPDPHFIELMHAADTAYRATQGLFDPTVQPLWQTLAKRHKPTEYYFLIGWDRVQFNANKITLDQRQGLTFNGIAQGFATDKVTEVLMSHGLTDVLVNIGEHRGLGGPWSLALDDPEFGHMGMRTLTTGAIATSSPMATPLIRGGHIIHATAKPRWSTVSVEATTATVADSLSTALVLARREEIEVIRARNDIGRITLVDTDGNLTSL